MKRNVMFAVMAVATFMVSTPVTADPLRPARVARPLPTYEIRTILRSTGLEPVGPVKRRGRNYVVRALDDDGRAMRVVVDARYGEIISIAPMAAPGPFRARPRIVTVPPFEGTRFGDVLPGFDEDDEPPLRPPRIVRRQPSAPAAKPRHSSPPPRPPRIVRRLPSAPAAKPQHPPIPRPRPAEASLAARDDVAPATRPAPAADAAPKKQAPKPDVEVPAVAPLDPGAHGPIAN